MHPFFFSLSLSDVWTFFHSPPLGVPQVVAVLEAEENITGCTVQALHSYTADDIVSAFRHPLIGRVHTVF
jgi:hypothetical protein